MQQPMQQEGQQEQEQQDGAIAAAEQRLLELHGRLWGLATELLLRPTERDDAEEQPQPSRASPPRPPRAIIEVRVEWRRGRHTGRSDHDVRTLSDAQ